MYINILCTRCSLNTYQFFKIVNWILSSFWSKRPLPKMKNSCTLSTSSLTWPHKLTSHQPPLELQPLPSTTTNRQCSILIPTLLPLKSLMPLRKFQTKTRFHIITLMTLWRTPLPTFLLLQTETELMPTISTCFLLTAVDQVPPQKENLYAETLPTTYSL